MKKNVKKINKELRDIIDESNLAVLEEQILKNEKIRYENQIKKVELEEQATINIVNQNINKIINDAIIELKDLLV